MSVSSARENIWTPANIVTLLRICGIPVFVVAIIAPWPAWLFPGLQEASAWRPWVAAALFILLACTDAIDGYLARSRNEVTNFGKLIDPLADKILVCAALIALVELQVLPSWVVLIILAREFIVSGVRMIAASQGTVIAASWYGKAKTVTQIIAIVLFILKDSLVPPETAYASFFYWFCWGCMIIALVLTIVSMLDYLSKARHLFGFQQKVSKKDAMRREQALEEGDLNVLSIGRSDMYESAERVLELARSRGFSIATAESLTGGLISATLTEVPGSSDVVRGSIVSYVNEAKVGLLGVPQGSIDEYGAVSESTVRAMAHGALEKFGATFAVATSGVAGPSESEGQPVGTVWIAVASDTYSFAHCYAFSGSREEVRAHTVASALYLLEEGMSLL